MKKISLSSLLIFALALTTLSACGGGGGGGSSSPPPFQPTTAVLTLSTTGTIPANTIIAGYDVTITLPAGVTVKSATPPVIDNGVLVGTVNGAAAGISLNAGYSPATGGIPGKVHIIVASSDVNGINAGEFSKVNCDITAGNPTASVFQQPTFTVSGLDVTDPLHPTTVDLTGQLSLTESAVIN
jgi:hypothetical protein